MSKEIKTIRNTLNETALLNRYLKSRGINPEFASKDQKVAHSKTNQFKAWMRDHINDNVNEAITTEPSPTKQRLMVLKKSIRTHKEVRTTNGHKKLHSEAVDKKDTVTFDIPLLIRVLEFAREDLKSDILLHNMVERLINMRGKGTLTMNEYGKIIKEEAESLGESYGPRADKLLAHSHSLYRQSTKEADPAKKEKMVKMSSKAHKVFMKAKEQHYKKNPAEYEKSRQAALTPPKGWPTESTEVEGEPIQEGSAALRLAQALKRERETRELKDATRKAREAQNSKTQQKPVEPVKESNLEPMAACNQPADGANNPDDTVKAKRSSKLKLLLGGKKKVVKEDMYDHEKEDKSVAGLKKPKVQKLEVDATTKETPQAAAVLKGGKTLTGEPRDTIEIDPMMKTRKKEPPDSQKSV